MTPEPFQPVAQPPFEPAPFDPALRDSGVLTEKEFAEKKRARAVGAAVARHSRRRAQIEGGADIERIEQLAAAIDRHTAALGDGIHATAQPRLAFLRNSAATGEVRTVYRPTLCIIAQGAKRAIAGDTVLPYAPGQYLTVSVEMPVIGDVTVASPEAPYLCLRLEIDPTSLGDLVFAERLRMERDDEPDLALSVGALSPQMLDAALRLIGVLDRPDDAPVLAPLYERELAYFLLAGQQGARLRQMAFPDSRSAQIAKAVLWIKARFDQPIRVEEVAAATGMSASSFHHHFKSVTALSPLQYQKQLRLQEARRMMVISGAAAASAAFAVGYASPQQFSREYARYFGAPPLRDVARLRDMPAGLHIAASA